MILTTEWIAGFFDGEGCVYFDGRRGPTLTLGNTRRDVVEAIQDHFGGVGNITKQWRSPNAFSKKPAWNWRCSHRQAEKVLVELRPYLRLKEKEADLALRFMATRNKRWTRNGVPSEVAKLRARLEYECRLLKR